MNVLNVLISIFTTPLYLFFLLLYFLVTFIANWKIFVKAGESGWKALIPIYNTCITFKIAWKIRYFFPYILTVLAMNLLPFFATSLSVLLFGTLGLYLCFIIFQILFCYKLARAFDRSLFFAIGLIVLGPVFMLILAFDSSEYEGPQ